MKESIGMSQRILLFKVKSVHTHKTQTQTQTKHKQKSQGSLKRQGLSHVGYRVCGLLKSESAAQRVSQQSLIKGVEQLLCHCPTCSYMHTFSHTNSLSFLLFVSSTEVWQPHNQSLVIHPNTWLAIWLHYSSSQFLPALHPSDCWCQHIQNVHLFLLWHMDKGWTEEWQSEEGLHILCESIILFVIKWVDLLSSDSMLHWTV